MKKPSLLLLTLLFVLAAAARADDLSDVKAAFATLLAYQRTDDPRLLDLFAKECDIATTLTDGINARVTLMDGKTFQQPLRDKIAKKQGNRDAYENVQYVREGAGVRVTATVRYSATGKRGPFSLLLVREPKTTGVYKIKELTATVPVLVLPK